MTTPHFFIRNAHNHDFQSIHRLLSLKSSKFLGPTKRKIFDPETFFEIYSTHSMLVKQKEEDQNIIGYMEFKHYPSIPALPVDMWMHWLRHHYCVELPVNHSNTLFLHYFIYDTNFCPELFIQLLCEVYFREPQARYIITLEPPYKSQRFKEDEPDFTILQPYATIYYPKDYHVRHCKNTQKIYTIVRNDIIPVMRFRKALPEDNDEIVEIINQDRPQIKESLGDYYIAEELLSELQHRTLIVAEVMNETVGFIWLNSSLNIIGLIKNFDLEEHGNLLKYNPNEKTKVLVRNITVMDHKPKHRLFSWQAMEGLYTESGKSRGPFILRSETSSLSLFSYFDMPNVGSSSSSSDDNESKLIKREIVFKKFNLLQNRLSKSDWYFTWRERAFFLKYNITPQGSLDVATSLNAFALQLYGLHQSNDVRKLYRFMIASFSAYPDRDYCVLSIPVHWKLTLPLQQLINFFIKIYPRPACSLNDHLYITHRASFMGDIIIHHIVAEDVPEIEKLIHYGLAEQEKENIENAKEAKETESKHNLGQSTSSNYNVNASPSAIYKHRRDVPSMVGPSLSKTSKFASKHSYRTLEELEEIDNDIPLEEEEAKILREILDEIFENPFSDYKCLTIRVGNCTKPNESNAIVGFAIVRQLNQVHLLRKHFIIPDCDDIRSFCHGELLMLKLHPFFRSKTDLIFREIARHSGYWDFYYFQPLKHKHKQPLSNDLMNKMQPVEPRRSKRKFFRDSDMIAFIPRKSIAAMPELHLSEDTFAVYQHNLRPTRYFGSTEAIVVIGYNDYTRAFLRLNTFSFNQHNNLNTNMYCCVPKLNITVISQPGIVEADQDADFLCDYCTDQNLCYINWLNADEFLRDINYRIDLTKWIKFVSGYVKSIDRTRQMVMMDNNCEIYYDRLLILSSIFFGPPKEISLSEDLLPPNYQHINNRFHKILVYHKLQALCEELPDAPPKLVVYGSRVRAFEFIHFLLTHGVKGESITLLMPLDTIREYEVYMNNPFIDRNIEIILQEMVEDLNVKVYERVKFSHWTCYRNDFNIETVSFRIRDLKNYEDELITLECDMFISFNESKSYLSMTDAFKLSDLEMVGQNIVVDTYSRTSDPRIIAYGRNTINLSDCNFQRRYTNPREVAEKLMAAIEAPFDLQVIPMEEKFHLPSTCKSQLPFNYYMMKICSPKLYLANHLSNQYQIAMTTYKDGDFFRIKMNEHYIIEEIVCVTQKVMSLDFLTFFCGKHEKLLNNLHLRWSTHRFDNFLEFFQEPWTELIMNDHFDELRQINREMIIDTMDDVLKYKRDYDRGARRSIAYRRLADMSIPSDMEEQLFNFLRKYRREFYFQFALPEDFSN